MFSFIIFSDNFSTFLYNVFDPNPLKDVLLSGLVEVEKEQYFLDEISIQSIVDINIIFSFRNCI